jgi:hypothetical protein
MFDRPTAAVRLRGAEGCVVQDCRVIATSGNGIRLDLRCQNNRIIGNEISHVGAVGVLLAGYGPGTKDVNRRKGFQPIGERTNTGRRDVTNAPRTNVAFSTLIARATPAERAMTKTTPRGDAHDPDHRLGRRRTPAGARREDRKAGHLG